MPRIRVTLSLDESTYSLLKERAEREDSFPATLAVQIIRDDLRRRAQDSGDGDPWWRLTDWLGPQVDKIRARGYWGPDIMVEVFELIEREGSELYAAAETDLGRAVLNPNLGRFIRMRLGADIALRNGRPHIARVPTRRTKLVQTVTLLKPRDEKPNE